MQVLPIYYPNSVSIASHILDPVKSPQAASSKTFEDQTLEVVCLLAKILFPEKSKIYDYTELKKSSDAYIKERKKFEPLQGHRKYVTENPTDAYRWAVAEGVIRTALCVLLGVAFLRSAWLIGTTVRAAVLLRNAEAIKTLFTSIVIASASWLLMYKSAANSYKTGQGEEMPPYSIPMRFQIMLKYPIMIGQNHEGILDRQLRVLSHSLNGNATKVNDFINNLDTLSTGFKAVIKTGTMPTRRWVVICNEIEKCISGRGVPVDEPILPISEDDDIMVPISPQASAQKAPSPVEQALKDYDVVTLKNVVEDLKSFFPERSFNPLKRKGEQ
jgi:hypothetical protein